MSNNIPLNEPSLSGNEWKYVKECLDSTWVSTAGKYINLFEEKICDFTKAKFAIACVNGTSALQLSLRLVGVRQGDEVIVPTITFIAPVNAVKYNGAEPIFMDSSDYYNIDIEKTIEFINKETIYKNGFTFNKKTKKKIKAIIPVHVWGNAVWLDELVELCHERNIAIVEDASESLGTVYKNGKHKGVHSGNIGKIGCLSFNGNKIITTGGGGMIITNDKKIAEKARYLTTQAKDDSLRYIHNDIGYNFRLTSLQAALGVAQLEQLPNFLKKKRYIYKKYFQALDTMENFSLSGVPSWANNNHWMNLIKIINKRDKYNKDFLLDKFINNNIQARPVWSMNHSQMPYKNCQSYKIDNAPHLIENSLCLPSSSSLSIEQLNQVLVTLNG